MSGRNGYGSTGFSGGRSELQAGDTLWLRREALALLRVHSALNEEAVIRLDDEAKNAVDAGCTAIALDLTAAEYVDSDGIRWLRRLRQALPDGAPAPRLRFHSDSGVERTLRLALEGEDFSLEPQ